MDINNEIIKIDTTEENFFNEYLTLKKPLLEFVLSKINGKEIILNPKLLRVFAMLLYYNNKYRELEEGVRWKMVFENGIRQNIAESLNINSKHLNTYISILRGIHLLTGKSISKPFILYPGEDYELTFKFIISDAK